MAAVEFFHIQQKGKIFRPLKAMLPCVVGTIEESNIDNKIPLARRLE